MANFIRLERILPLKSMCGIIAATHQDLETLVDQGRFREDLFHRLNVIRIHIPGVARAQTGHTVATAPTFASAASNWA